MSIFDHPDAVPTAPSWRCPHCRTLQPETSRCSACARAAVTCSTCHLYRTSVAPDVGYCAHDRTRTPVDADEVRACWEASPTLDVTTGLFDGSVLAPTSAPPVAPRSVPVSKVLPPNDEEDLGGAGLARAPQGRLVEAPAVAPGRQLMSELQRRVRQGRERRRA